MKILVCGGGRITDELLKRIGENWEITLIDREEAKLAPFSRRFPTVEHLMAEDASSPVVLEKAGVSDCDCVLALTNDDPVNLAIARFAREAGVNNVLSVVRDPEMLPEFQKLDIWIVSMATDMARKIYQFLKDPRIRIIDLGEGEGELLELTVGKRDLSRLRKLASRGNTDWQMMGVLRDNRLLFSRDLERIEEGDRLLVLGRGELYNAFSNHLAQDRPHFPRTYGQEMILGIAADTPRDATQLLNEAFYVAQGTHIVKITAVCEKTDTDIQNTLSRWSESLQIEVLKSEGQIRKRVASIARDSDAGMVVIRHAGRSLLQSIFGGNLVQMAAELPCPLLLAKRSNPYKRLLVPFNGSLAGQRALEIAMDLSRHLDAEVSAVVVVEPSYLRGAESSTGQWENRMLKQVRELAHVHKIKVDEQVRHGNPVKEILSIADDYQLLVIGGDEDKAGLFSLDVAGVLADRARCSVLLVS